MRCNNVDVQNLNLHDFTPQFKKNVYPRIYHFNSTHYLNSQSYMLQILFLF